MVVSGYEVPDKVLKALDSVVLSGELFRAGDLQAAAEAAGVPAKDGVSMRVADRYIQKAKRAGQIQLAKTKPFWQKVN